MFASLINFLNMIKSKNFKSRWGSYVVTFSILASVSFATVAPIIVSTVFAGCPPGRTSVIHNEGMGDAEWEECVTRSSPTTSATNFRSLLAILQNVIDAVIPFLVGLAVMLIIYGILSFISKAADEEKRTEAKNFIIWGIIGIFVMVSIWGLVNILVGTFGFGASNTPQVVTDTYGKAYDASGREITDRAAVLAKKPTTVIDLITRINLIGSYVLPFLIGIGFFILIFGIVGYIRQGDNEEKRAEGRMFIIWGIVSIFVMLSIWGFVNILVNTFNLENTLPVTSIPDLIPEYKP